MIQGSKQDRNRINLSLTNGSYEIVIKSDGLNEAGKELINAGFKPGTKVLLVSNSEINKHYGDVCLNSLQSEGFKAEKIILEAGEQNKTPKQISLIHDAAYKYQLERSSLLIALGGGIVGDMTGFAAATWLRGIAVVQIPTTLLAMVDASIGGKTGVNHPGGKNLIGAFHQPSLVLIDPKTLETLPSRELRAGMAEVIKYGIIKDPILFKKLEEIPNLNNPSSIDKQDIKDILERSAKAKVEVVESDVKEAGVRAILNYGHTFGHAIETLCGYGTWLHGEAVAIGMVIAGELAVIKKSWKKEDASRQKELIKRAGLPIDLPDIESEKIWDILLSDKKVKDGKIRFILPVGIGKVRIRDDITKQEVMQCLAALR